MKNCPDIGTLKAYVDGECEHAATSEIMGHLNECSTCRECLAELESTASFTASHMRGLAPIPSERLRLTSADVLIASQARAGNSPGVIRRSVENMSNFLSNGKRKAAFAGLAAVLVLAVAFAIPPVRTAADEFLSIFRVEKFETVSVDPNTRIDNLMDLTKLGEVETLTPYSEPVKFESLDAAKVLSSLRVKAPTYLPEGVSADAASVQMTNNMSMKFTFDNAKAKTYLAEIGETKFTVPDRFDGAGFQVNVPPVLAATYGDFSSGTEGSGEAPSGVLMIAEANSPTVETFGNVSIGDLREFLLSMPGLPDSLVSQLRAIDDWSTTMPVPVPMNTDIADEITVNGNPGLIVADDSMNITGVVWNENGTLYAVGGSFPKDEIMKVAESMK